MSDEWRWPNAEEAAACDALYRAMGWRFQMGMQWPLAVGLVPDVDSFSFHTTSAPMIEENGREDRYWFGIKFWVYRR